MYISPISYTATNIKPAYKYNRNNIGCKNIAFCGSKKYLGNKSVIAGLLFIAGLLSYTGCNNIKKNNPYENRDKEFYDSRYGNHIDSIAIGLNDTLTQAQIEQRDRMIEEKDKAFEDLPYGTPERDYAEKIAYDQVDSVTLPSSDKGKEIIYFEEAQILINSEDSIKAKFPNKKIQVRL